MATPVRASEGQGLLVRLPNYVGDTVCALPALHRLAAGGPLIALGRAWAVPLLAAAGIETQTYPKGLRARVAALRAAARDVDAQRIVLLSNSFGSALESRLAGLRPLGYAKDGRRLLLADSAGALPEAHLVEIYQRLADRVEAAAPREAAWAPPWPGARADAGLVDGRGFHDARAAVSAALGHPAPYVVLVPKAGGLHAGASKDWPQFGALVPALRTEGLRVLMAPGPGEAAAFSAAAPGAEAIDGLGLVAFGALAAGARLVIAPDGGQAHLAAAAGARVVCVMGPTRPERVRPWSPRVEVLGGNGQWPTLEAVEAAIRRQLEASA